MRTGRPSSFDQVVATQICERLASGESLRNICRDDDMPDRSTVQRWLDSFIDFRGQYARARELQADYWAEEILEIADTVRIGDKIKVGKDGTEVTTGDMVDRAKLQVDARKWIVSKLLPKKYGDRITQEHTGADGEKIAVNVLINRPKSPSAAE